MVLPRHLRAMSLALFLGGPALAEAPSLYTRGAVNQKKYQPDLYEITNIVGFVIYTLQA